MQKDNQNSARPLSQSALSLSSVKKLMLQYVNDDTQIKPEAVTNLHKVLVEHTRRITMEAEKLSKYEGLKRISEYHIRDAVRTYFGVKGK